MSHYHPEAQAAPEKQFTRTLKSFVINVKLINLLSDIYLQINVDQCTNIIKRDNRYTFATRKTSKINKYAALITDLEGRTPGKLNNNNEIAQAAGVFTINVENYVGRIL